MAVSMDPTTKMATFQGEVRCPLTHQASPDRLWSGLRGGPEVSFRRVLRTGAVPRRVPRVFRGGLADEARFRRVLRGFRNGSATVPQGLRKGSLDARAGCHEVSARFRGGGSVKGFGAVLVLTKILRGFRGCAEPRKFCKGSDSARVAPSRIPQRPVMGFLDFVWCQVTTHKLDASWILSVGCSVPWFPSHATVFDLHTPYGLTWKQDTHHFFR